MGGCVGAPSTDEGQLWQDRQIRWDIPKQQIALRPGEVLHKTWDMVEDVKGNTTLGKLQLTNLRMVWLCGGIHRASLSIGFGTILFIHFNMTETAHKGKVRAPNITTSFNRSTFEFSFACDSPDNYDMYSSMDITHKMYRATRYYRDLVLRDEKLLKDDTLDLLHVEILETTCDECENLTTDDAFPGTLFVTNYRLVWMSRATPNINVSVPYLQIKSLSMRHSRFGIALVVETSSVSGRFILGFRFTNSLIMNSTLSLAQRLHNKSKLHPCYGPELEGLQIVGDTLVHMPPDTEGEVEGDMTRGIRHYNGIRSPTLRASHTIRNTPGEETDSTSADNPHVVRVLDSSRILSTLDLSKAGDREIPVVEDEVALSPQSRKYASKCIVCFTRKYEVAFDPCGHICCCLPCAELIDKDLCPVCRIPITKYLRIFITR
eukprot:GHVR01013277.1.p1 GENE.GHVR01013277.1~~GHVR01013277.1.p1  ORF type:complete len:433 (+),score=57.72 GHVR01013277.1:71-1369(+)